MLVHKNIISYQFFSLKSEVLLTLSMFFELENLSHLKEILLPLVRFEFLLALDLKFLKFLCILRHIYKNLHNIFPKR